MLNLVDRSSKTVPLMGQASKTFDAVVVGARIWWYVHGPISCAVKGSRCAVLNAAAVWVALGFGIVIQGVAVMLKVMEYSYQFSDGLQQDWPMERALFCPAGNFGLCLSMSRIVLKFWVCSRSIHRLKGPILMTCHGFVDSAHSRG